MKFSRYMMWNFMKMFLIVLLGALLKGAVIDFVRRWLCLLRCWPPSVT